MRASASLNLFCLSRYDGVVFKQTFPFYGLRPDSKYEVRVRAKNEEGWSEPGKSFIFTTPKFDRHLTSAGSKSTSQIPSESLIVMFAMIGGHCTGGLII